MDPIESREEILRRQLAASLASRAGGQHPEPELIVAHAAGELAPEYGLALTRHLAACNDGRCTAVLRDATAGAALAREALYGPRAEAEDETASPEEAPVTTGSPVGAPHAPDHRERTFACADDLWEAFTALAQEEGRSVDQLLEEAMQTYAQAARGSTLPPPPDPSVHGGPEHGPMPRAPIEPLGVATPRDVTFKEAPAEPPRERNTPTIQRSYLPRAPASSRRASPQPAPHAQHLSVVLEGVRYEVTKDRFVVGRAGRASDLAIDDPGVSRQHALIEHTGGAYYLVDMGSTNGVEYEGQRIARKEITHGDRFRIGDHELEFLFS